MKKIVLLAALIFSLTTMYGQELRLGFQGSPVVSWMGTNDNSITGNGSNVGFKLGLITEYYFQDNYAVTSGLSLVFNQGGTLNYTTGGNFFPNSELSDSTYFDLPNNVDINYKLQVLEVPLGIKLKTNEMGYFRYYGEIPFLIHIKTQGRAAFEDTTKENVSPDVGLLNVSWGVGGGVEYSISGNTALTAGVYFHNGLLDMTTNKATQNTGQAEDAKSVINSLTFRFGILF